MRKKGLEGANQQISMLIALAAIGYGVTYTFIPDFPPQISVKLALVLGIGFGLAMDLVITVHDWVMQTFIYKVDELESYSAKMFIYTLSVVPGIASLSYSIFPCNVGGLVFSTIALHALHLFLAGKVVYRSFPAAFYQLLGWD